MPIWRLQTTIWQDTTTPEDGMVLTPHFNDHGLTTDPDGLCEDLAAAIDAWSSGTQQIRVKAYDAQGTPPVYPQGDHEVNTGLAPASSGVRETAVCLSFYSQQNRARYRGRLYVPTVITGQATSAPRPGTTMRQKVADLVPILASLGGVDVDWVVYSRIDDAARKVSHWWVDDAWDTVRSRGLRPSARTEGTTGG